MAKAKSSDPFAIKLDDADLRGLLRSFSKMDEVAKSGMKEIAADIANKTAQAVRQAASSAPNPRQALAVISSLEVVATSKDPSLKIIRKNVVTASGARSGQIFVGSEFGSNKFKQFPKRSARFGKGNEGYYLYKTLRDKQPTILAQWLDGFKLVRDAWTGRV